MICTAEQYKDSKRDSPAACINGEHVTGVIKHPQFKLLVEADAVIYDIADDKVKNEIMITEQGGQISSIGNALPYTQHWTQK